MEWSNPDIPIAIMMQFSLFGELNRVAAINQKQTTFFQSEKNSLHKNVESERESVMAKARAMATRGKYKQGDGGNGK